MKKQLRVFLSSRFGENNFIHLRDKIKKAMEEKFSDIGIVVIALEKDNDPRTPLEASIEESEDSHFLIHILGETYGTPIKEYENKSYTHLEYDVAIKNNIKIFAYPIGDIYVSNPKQLSNDKNFRQWQEDVLFFQGVVNKSFPTNYNDNEIVEQIVNDFNKYINLILYKANKKIYTHSLYSTVPPLIDESEYLEREIVDEIKQSLLGRDNTVSITSKAKVGLHGMGGIGKTISAIAIGNDKEIRDCFTDGIYFVSLGKDPDISKIQRELLDNGFGIYEENPSSAKLRAVFENKKCLLIVDNVWKRIHLKEFEVLSKRGKLLITTRQKELIVGAKVHTVDVLTDELAYKLLDTKVDGITKEKKSLAHEILAETGRLPLAINIIGQTLNGKDVEYWRHILKRLKDSDIEKIKIRNVENEEHANLYRVIDTSVAFLSKEAKEKYLELVIFENVEIIPQVTLLNFWGIDAYDILDELVDSALLKKEKDKKDRTFYQLHDLQKDYIVSSNTKGRKEKIKNFIEVYQNKFAPKWHKIPINDFFFYKEGVRR